eukprot:2684002-Alexandrium_andersonii.AAC.1
MWPRPLPLMLSRTHGEYSGCSWKVKKWPLWWMQRSRSRSAAKFAPFTSAISRACLTMLTASRTVH